MQVMLSALQLERPSSSASVVCRYSDRYFYSVEVGRSSGGMFGMFQVRLGILLGGSGGHLSHFIKYPILQRFLFSGSTNKVPHAGIHESKVLLGMQSSP